MTQNKALSMALVYFAGTLVLLCGMLIWQLWPEPAPYAPLYGFNSPQPILSAREIRPGDSIIVQSVKCNSDREPISVTGERHWRRLEPTVTTIPDGISSTSFPPGCLERVFENITPLTLTPGTWVLEGVNSTARGAQVQNVAWTTEPFTVLDP